MRISHIEPWSVILSRTKYSKTDLFQSYDKIPYSLRKKMQRDKNATKNFDYTTIADRLRSVSWINEIHPTCVV